MDSNRNSLQCQPLHEGNMRLVQEITEKARQLNSLFSLLKTREMAIAATNLEQAVMWATKAIVLKDTETNEPIRDL